MSSNKQLINSLTLFLSCGCNLSCEYCLISQSSNQNSHNIQQQTIQALQNGMFLQNTVNTLNTLKSSPLNINHIEFWGQEPTLTLDYFTSNLQDWLNTFPNIQSLFFSTNGKEYPEKIIDFLIQFDKYIKHKATITVQFSYDGNYSNDNLRKIESDRITNNIKQIFTELNKIKFNNLNIEIFLHAVISKNLINEINTIENADNYCEKLYNWRHQISQYNINNAIHFPPTIGFGLENPIEASQDDGINLLKFYKLIKYCKYNQQHNFIVSNNIKRLIMRNVTSKKFDNILNFLDISADNEFNLKHLSLHKGYCGANYGELKIMYDGTILNCQNQIFDTDNNFINNNDPMLYSIKLNENIHQKICNPLKDDIKVIDKVFRTFSLLKENNFKQLYNNTLNLMYILSKCGQIDKSYQNDYQKLLYHSYIISRYNCCSYNKLIKTGSMLLSNTGNIRWFCNGFLDEICKDEELIKYE